MDSLKNIAKGGWHPERDKKPSYTTSSSSSGSGFKGVDQIKGWMGKGAKSDGHDPSAHQSAPLSSLRDPSEFGPPPKRTDYSGAVPPPAASTTRPAPAVPSRTSTLNARGDAEAPPPPSGPYRADTTGLNTANLPPPPRRGDSWTGNTSPSVPTRQVTSPLQSPPAPNKPKLPPRLPPRNAAPPPSPPPAYTETAQPNTGLSSANTGALNRLGSAGISVPGFNIGRTSSPPTTTAQSAASPSATKPQPSSLQSRFAKLGTSSTTANQSQPSIPSDPSTTDSGGTTWAQKRAALQTASQVQKDPSKVSFNDMRSAASTANNFRERHGEQVASGMSAANGVNQKYGVLDRVNQAARPDAAVPVAGKKAPPPPPPPKKRLLGGQGEGSVASPPPIPLGSKPRP